MIAMRIAGKSCAIIWQRQDTLDLRVCVCVFRLEVPWQFFRDQGSEQRVESDNTQIGGLRGLREVPDVAHDFHLQQFCIRVNRVRFQT